MAFLSHTIPWTSLASLFEYRGARSGPGPQNANLFAKGKPGQVKQLEHFATKFQEVVREHSAIERKKYRPLKAYVERSKTWTVTSDEVEVDESDVHRPTRNRGPRLPEVDSVQAWPTSEETRSVFPLNFSERYLPSVPITSGHAYGREGLVNEFAHIETWIALCTRRKSWSSATNDEQNRMWLDERSCSDIIRLLIIDAATTEDPKQQKTAIETIFLLAHHPQIGLQPFLGLGMSCCNISVGIHVLAEKVLSAFLYLNILCTLTADNSSGPLTRPCEDFDPATHTGTIPHYRNPDRFVTLKPRPAYMNTESYSLLLSELLDEHGHKVEHVFFTPLFAPRPSGHFPGRGRATSDDEKRHERDVLSDLPALKAALKSMWKMLVYSDMLLCEAGRGPNWDYAFSSAMDGMFHGKRLFGEFFVHYEDRRRETEDFRLFSRD